MLFFIIISVANFSGFVYTYNVFPVYLHMFLVHCWIFFKFNSILNIVFWVLLVINFSCCAQIQQHKCYFGINYKSNMRQFMEFLYCKKKFGSDINWDPGKQFIITNVFVKRCVKFLNGFLHFKYLISSIHFSPEEKWVLWESIGWFFVSGLRSSKTSLFITAGGRQTDGYWRP